MQTSTIERSFARILHDLRNELLKVSGLGEKFELGLLLALAFADDDTGKTEPIFGNVHSQYSIEKYWGKARKILIARPELGQLGRLLDNIEKGLNNQINSDDTKRIVVDQQCYADK